MCQLHRQLQLQFDFADFLLKIRKKFRGFLIQLLQLIFQCVFFSIVQSHCISNALLFYKLIHSSSVGLRV